MKASALFKGEIITKYQSSSTHCSKVISKVKVSERRKEWQNDRQDKNMMPPNLRSRGHKKLPITIQAIYLVTNTFTTEQWIFGGLVRSLLSPPPLIWKLNSNHFLLHWNNYVSIINLHKFRCVGISKQIIFRHFYWNSKIPITPLPITFWQTLELNISDLHSLVACLWMDFKIFS